MHLIAQGSSLVLLSLGTCTYAIHPNTLGAKFKAEGILTNEESFYKRIRKFRVLDGIRFIRYTAVDMHDFRKSVAHYFQITRI